MTMMIFPLIEAARAVVLVSATAPWCPVVPAPQISVMTTRQLTEIRQNYNKDELKALRADTALPYQMQDLSHVETGGVMRGDIDIKYDVSFGEIPGNTAETVNHSCVRYAQIKITLHITPLIFIAREYGKDSCWYKEIHKHEELHIDVDEEVVKKYAQRIEDGLKLAFAAPDDFIDGPVKPKKAAVLKKEMGHNLVAMIDVLAKDMARERLERQQEVDSLGGYGEIMNACYHGPTVFRPAP
ncbi:MAG: hypothetical protein ACXW4B_10660 [Micavibrio sp.]